METVTDETQNQPRHQSVESPRVFNILARSTGDELSPNSSLSDDRQSFERRSQHHKRLGTLHIHRRAEWNSLGGNAYQGICITLVRLAGPAPSCRKSDTESACQGEGLWLSPLPLRLFLSLWQQKGSDYLPAYLGQNGGMGTHIESCNARAQLTAHFSDANGAKGQSEDHFKPVGHSSTA